MGPDRKYWQTSKLHWGSLQLVLMISVHWITKRETDLPTCIEEFEVIKDDAVIRFLMEDYESYRRISGSSTLVN